MWCFIEFESVFRMSVVEILLSSLLCVIVC